MAVQKNVIKGILAGTFALMLSGCVTVPDAIKGSSPTPQQDLVRVMSAPQLYVGQEARFGGKVVAVQNQQGKTRLEIATVPLDSGARPTLGEPSRGRIYADVNGFLDPVDFSGDGHINLWDPVDAIGSVANYFKAHGWVKGDQVAVMANGQAPGLPNGFKTRYSISQLAAAGLTPQQSLGNHQQASLLRLIQQIGRAHV